ncbi:conserved Plasmodium protein, unknown function [Plasmodium berghei]|uniref:RIIa domain-containing protein n=2 Tax=Plasmodium berghei TaxID=5821 RepID=A0A509AKW9_PLABA|nr:conserved Plasmodium protein, unknown function [Plasmodium berghei ANKA]CXI52384.1 conserved Plasmodium protein, unknown function [Plasmodium berghei]SCL94610.1 conserved Plasmodium protein, unknown function [Plasmodium berghei]SCM16065.1 conserved Plasmodium protein, unknown function [Plasmodium berghei]SCM17860.1 conserved Plasmodium protein, unknown function [Plasmodium berghei]SCN26162.1 conserved Plasmodium protein, unknown function [Plasmodium berghei]|eukprot:XP_034421989.1 conserved Plasmodium protein, unknown function [Plasmodium berghei ANKA]
MSTFNVKEDYSSKYEEELSNETDRRLMNFPTSRNVDITHSSFCFQNIEPDYFITNDYNRSLENDKTGDIIFEKDHDKERKKNEEKKIFLFDLSDEQKMQVEKYKINKIIQNEMYLKKNKVLKYVIQIFLSDLLKEKPDNVYEYAANYFTKPNLKQIILQKLKNILNRL